MAPIKTLREIPPIGTAREQIELLQLDRLGGLERFNRARGDIGRFGVLYGPMVLVNTPELIQDVLVTHAKVMEKSPIIRGALHPLAGNGLFTSEGELWRTQRKLMAPLFHAKAVERFARDMTGCTLRIARQWPDGGVVDVAHECTRVAMSVAGKSLFGMDTVRETEEIGAALTVALEWVGEQATSIDYVLQIRAMLALEGLSARLPRSVGAPLAPHLSRLMLPLRLPSRRSRKLAAALDVLDARVTRLIDERKRDAVQADDLLALLLDARDDQGLAMSERQVRDEIVTLFVAGHETTATTLAWALMLLGQHPEVYRAARAEVDALGRVPNAADLPALPLTTRVFKETLRLYPPVWMLARVTTAEVTLGEYQLPKGTIVAFSAYALHRKPELWPEPERFDPERFAPEREASRPRGAYIPFSMGPRTCIGTFFALLEGPLALATLLRELDFELLDKRGVAPVAHATLRPEYAISMRVRRRRARDSRHSDRPNGLGRHVA